MKTKCHQERMANCFRPCFTNRFEFSIGASGERAAPRFALGDQDAVKSQILHVLHQFEAGIQVAGPLRRPIQEHLVFPWFFTRRNPPAVVEAGVFWIADPPPHGLGNGNVLVVGIHGVQAPMAR